MKVVAICLCALILCGCTTVKVKPVPRDIGLHHVCIKKNKKVIVEGFLPIVRAGFSRHGISTEVFVGKTPSRCQYILTYTAFQDWDFTLYMDHAELHLWNDGRLVASGIFDLVGGGGFAITKWRSTETKMRPVINKLLQKYHDKENM